MNAERVLLAEFVQEAVQARDASGVDGQDDDSGVTELARPRISS